MKRTCRILAFVLAVLLLMPMGLISCGKQKMPDKQVMDHVFRVTEIPMPENMSWFNQLTVEGEKIRITGGYYNEETYESYDVTYEMNLDGTGLTDITPPREEKKEEPAEDVMIAPAVKPGDVNTHTYEMARIALPDGTLWIGTCTYTYDPVTYSSTEEYTFAHQTADGEILSSFTDEDVFGGPVKEGEYRSLYNATLCGSSNILLSGYDGSGECMFLVNAADATFKRLDTSKLLESGYIQQNINDGEDMYFLHCDYSGSRNEYSLIPLDVKEAKLGDPIPLEGDGFENMYNFFEGEGYTFYFMNETAVYGFDLATASAVEILNFMNSDLNYNVAYNLKVISPEKFVTYGYDSFTQTEAIYILDKVPEEELVAKYVITVAVLQDDWTLREQAIRFNRQSDEYRININKYDLNDYLAEGEDYDYNALMEEAVTAMNNDIIAGKGPDVLLTNSYMPVDSYIAKGLLVDLYPYIDKDERFDRSDFLPNVLSALEVDGGLYEIFPNFGIRTLVGKTEIVGDRKAWTMSDFARWARDLPEKTKVFFDLNREDVFDLLLSFCYEEFIDADTGTCTFDSAAFADLLTFVSTLPEKVIDDTGMYDEEYWMQYDNRFREDYAALEQAYISSFSFYPNLINNTFFTEEITMVGAPTAGDNGGAITPAEMSFAISSKTPLKDGAWEFVSYFLTKEYQEKINYYFPLRVDALDAMMEQAVKSAEEQKQRYEEQMGNMGGGYDADGDGVMDDMAVVLPETAAPAETTAATAETEPAETEAEAAPAAETEAVAEKAVAVTTSAIGGIIGMPSPYPGRNERVYLSREMAETVRDYITSVNRVIRQNASVTAIIREDAAAFFAGQKSLEETVKLIQNRVSTYVAENS